MVKKIEVDTLTRSSGTDVTINAPVSIRNDGGFGECSAVDIYVPTIDATKPGVRMSCNNAGGAPVSRDGLAFYQNFSNGYSEIAMVFGNSPTQWFEIGHHNGTTYNRRFMIDNAGRAAIGSHLPSARLHLPAGTAAANTAPAKLTSGTALTTPEDGALEYHNSHLYFTIGSTRYQLDQQSGGAGLTYWTESETGAVDKTTTLGSASSATNVSNRIGNVLGNGSLVIGVNNGNARGYNAIDISAYRNTTDLVASGYASIAVGYNTRASGTNSVSLGTLAKSDGTYSIAIGTNALANADNAMALGYGSSAHALKGKIAISNGQFSNTGDSQNGHFILRTSSTSATPMALTCDTQSASSTNQILPSSYTVMSGFGYIIGKQRFVDADVVKVWKIEFVVRRGATTTSIVGTPAINAVAADAGASTWGSPTITIDGNNAVKLTVTGAASTNIRWMADVYTSEMYYYS